MYVCMYIFLTSIDIVSSGIYSYLLTWSCLVTSSRQLGHHKVSTVDCNLHHPDCCCIRESRGDQEFFGKEFPLEFPVKVFMSLFEATSKTICDVTN